MTQLINSTPEHNADVVRRGRHLEPVGSAGRTAGPAEVVLHEGTLPLLAPRCAVPTYDRAALSTGVVHLGVGNFHRALARHRGDGARALIVESGLFGELAQDRALAATVQRLVHDLRESGWQATLAACLAPAAALA